MTRSLCILKWFFVFMLFAGLSVFFAMVLNGFVTAGWPFWVAFVPAVPVAVLVTGFLVMFFEIVFADLKKTEATV